MKNPLTSLKEKAKNLVAQLKTPDVQEKILKRSGIGLLGGAAIGLGVLIFAPALAVPAGCATLGLMGVGFGLIQEGDNVKYAAWMKEHPPVAAPVPVQPAPEKPAPVAEVKPAAPEFKAAVEQQPAPAAPVPEVVAKPEAPKP